MTTPKPGIAEIISPDVRRVLAPNPGPMTHWGTNSYILGKDHVAVIDPGPDLPAHLEALLKATQNAKITHILVTHAHADHSPLARILSDKTDAPIYGFGAPTAGRSATMQNLAKTGLAGGGEGVDLDFVPDQTVVEGDIIEGSDWQLGVLHTPGHFAGHLAFQTGNVVFSGDHVMDWSSSLVSPPDGDLGAFMRTSERLKNLGANVFLPGHGNPIDTPTDRLDWLIQHRKSRETSILAALDRTPQSIPDITATVYRDTPLELHGAAARNVFAHLIDLVERNLVIATPDLGLTSQYART